MGGRMTEHIPEVWKAAVLGILAQGLCSDRLRVTARARRDFEDMFTDQMAYEMVDLFADILRDPTLHGRRVVGMEPPGETYEFIFEHRGKQVYGKIGLHDNGELVILFSAHRPLKGDAL